VVDGGCVAMPDLVKQSIYVEKDCGVPRATAIVPHLKERCPAVVSRCYLFFLNIVVSTDRLVDNTYCHLGGRRHPDGNTSAWESSFSKCA
jgi:molybdopterin/thiamine biosynthesis adenylyltransferase